jgi:hypothetical protein
MALFEDPTNWKKQEIHHIDPRPSPPLSREEQGHYQKLARDKPDITLPWVIPLEGNPPWLSVAFPPLLKYPPFPLFSQKTVSVLAVLTLLFLVLMAAVPDSAGCFLTTLIFFLLSMVYLKQAAFPEFLKNWNCVHKTNRHCFDDWQRDRAQVTKQWLSDMEQRHDIWHQMMVQDADQHFSQADQLMKELVRDKRVTLETVKTIERGRARNLVSRARNAESVKDYSTAARYYHRSGDERKARELNELAQGGRHFVNVGPVDQSVTIKDSVVQRSSISPGRESRELKDSVTLRNRKEPEPRELAARTRAPVKSDDQVTQTLLNLSRRWQDGELSEQDFQKEKKRLRDKGEETGNRNV